MTADEALVALGLLDDTLSAGQVAALEVDGFFVVDEVLDGGQLAAMGEAFDCIVASERDAAGAEVSQEVGATRISNVFNKSRVYDAAMAPVASLAAARHLLGDFRFHSLNVREPQQGFGQQPLHSDVPRYPGQPWRLINTMVAIDRVTDDNGPTRVVPGSHRWPHINVPAENLQPGEPQNAESGEIDRIPDDPRAPYPGEVLVTLRPGALAVINAHMWHGGTANRSGGRRRLMHVSFGRRDVPQQVDQQAALTPAFHARLSDAQRWLLDITAPPPGR